MKRTVRKAKHWGVALLLLPLCYGVARAMGAIFFPFKDVPEGSFYFFAGVGSYFAFQWACFRPIRTYVFGHELTHAMAAWLSGGKVKHFHVSKKGGSVSVTKTNVFIALAPYIIPLYALLLLALFFGVNYFYPLRLGWWSTFLWFLGVSIGFHMALTVYALKQNQPDLKTSGRFLSAVIIYLGNTASIIFLLGVLFPRTVSWSRFMRLSGEHALHFVQHVYTGGQTVWQETSYVARHGN